MAKICSDIHSLWLVISLQSNITGTFLTWNNDLCQSTHIICIFFSNNSVWTHTVLYLRVAIFSCYAGVACMWPVSWRPHLHSGCPFHMGPRLSCDLFGPMGPQHMCSKLKCEMCSHMSVRLVSPEEPCTSFSKDERSQERRVQVSHLSQLSLVPNHPSCWVETAVGVQGRSVDELPEPEILNKYLIIALVY